MNIVKQLRKRAGMQQQELADMVGVARPTVSEWETQKKDPSGERLQKLSQIFGVDPLIVLGCGIIDLSHFDSDEPPQQAPQTPEARIVSFSMDQLPQAEREKILSVLRIMYMNNPKLFREETNNDDT